MYFYLPGKQVYYRHILAIKQIFVLKKPEILIYNKLANRYLHNIVLYCYLYVLRILELNLLSILQYLIIHESSS